MLGNDDEGSRWVRHVCAAILGFTVSLYVLGRLADDHQGLDDWVVVGAITGGLVCCNLSIWLGRDFWAYVRRLFGMPY